MGGVTVHDDRLLYELLALEAAQAGLSWRTILRKRENFKKDFDNFDVAKVASFGETERQRLLTDAGIVRNRLKIDAVISNAQHYLEVQREFGSFDKYVWQFTGNKTLRSPGVITFDNMPTFTPESATMSKDLKKRRFRFVGPTICYVWMQGIGMVNDHLTSCFCAPLEA